MTPVPLQLPLRLSDAAELAHLIFEHAERKPLTEEVRSRLAARAAALKLESLRPYFASLERDPVHPSAYYLAIDTPEGPEFILHIALATAPTSSIFPKPLLIGRTRPVNSPECVINAIPFGPGDSLNIEKFAAVLNTAFLPKLQGARASLTVAENLPAAFDLFRRIHKRTGKNLAATSGGWHAAVWAAIRAGWRLGFSACHVVSPGDLGEHAAFTRFAVDASSLEAAAQMRAQIRQARATRKLPGAFEFDPAFGAVSPDEWAASLEYLRNAGHAASFATLPLSSPELGEFAAIARRHQVTLSFRYGRESGGVVAAAARATAGRLNFYVATPAEAEFVAEHIL